MTFERKLSESFEALGYSLSAWQTPRRDDSEGRFNAPMRGPADAVGEVETVACFAPEFFAFEIFETEPEEIEFEENETVPDSSTKWTGVDSYDTPAKPTAAVTPRVATQPPALASYVLI